MSEYNDLDKKKTFTNLFVSHCKTFLGDPKCVSLLQ